MLILHIETGTAVCSAALSRNEALLALKENEEGRAHAQCLAVYIDELMHEQHLSIHDLDAVAVSEGPGSYTGLRVGVSTAKGICFGANKPLIAINSLQSLVFSWQSSVNSTNQQNSRQSPVSSHQLLVIPMIDARRMEVYTAVFNAAGEQLSEIEAKIIDENSFSDLVKDHQIVFIGDGAEKCKNILSHPNAHFPPIHASATGMIKPAVAAFQAKKFVDTAYFEPFYLKDFVAIPSKKNILGKYSSNYC
jgi:tRNA threonylcarbamoyladenosine biosynthesis protein TsaB